MVGNEACRLACYLMSHNLLSSNYTLSSPYVSMQHKTFYYWTSKNAKCLEDLFQIFCLSDMSKFHWLNTSRLFSIISCFLSKLFLNASNLNAIKLKDSLNKFPLQYACLQVNVFDQDPTRVQISLEPRANPSKRT